MARRGAELRLNGSLTLLGSADECAQWRVAAGADHAEILLRHRFAKEYEKRCQISREVVREIIQLAGCHPNCQ
ncbi:hypothetical protein DL765_003814 [Monosporascus sp. GIB2]|nr:hypothetical protein DL765_003814 [Monosporascus sp. GIB2]